MENFANDKLKKTPSKMLQIKAPLFKIVFAGDSEVGKTTMIRNFIVINFILTGEWRIIKRKI